MPEVSALSVSYEKIHPSRGKELLKARSLLVSSSRLDDTIYGRRTTSEGVRLDELLKNAKGKTAAIIGAYAPVIRGIGPVGVPGRKLVGAAAVSDLTTHADNDFLALTKGMSPKTGAKRSFTIKTKTGSMEVDASQAAHIHFTALGLDERFRKSDSDMAGHNFYFELLSQAAREGKKVALITVHRDSEGQQRLSNPGFRMGITGDPTEIEGLFNKRLLRYVVDLDEFRKNYRVN